MFPNKLSRVQAKGNSPFVSTDIVGCLDALQKSFDKVVQKVYTRRQV